METQTLIHTRVCFTIQSLVRESPFFTVQLNLVARNSITRTQIAVYKVLTLVFKMHFQIKKTKKTKKLYFKPNYTVFMKPNLVISGKWLVLKRWSDRLQYLRQVYGAQSLKDLLVQTLRYWGSALQPKSIKALQRLFGSNNNHRIAFQPYWILN